MPGGDSGDQGLCAVTACYAEKVGAAFDCLVRERDHVLRMSCVQQEDIGVERLGLFLEVELPHLSTA